MGSKEIVVGVHTKPDADCFFPTALLLLMAGVKIVSYYFIKSGDEALPPQFIFKNIRFIDRGRRDLDHHGQQGVTSTDLVVQELGIAEEKWIQPITRYVRRSDLEGESEPFTIAEMGKALAHEESISDEKRMELGVEMAGAIVEFHEKSLSRDNALAQKVISEFAKKKGQIPARWLKYSEQLSNPRFQRVCDLVEILVREKSLRGEEEARKFGQALLGYLYLDFERYLAAKEEAKKAQSIPVGATFIKVGQSDNPKFSVACREIGAIAVIQKNSDGHVQIYFDYQRILHSAITTNIIAFLRVREMQLNDIALPKWKNKLGYLAQAGAIEECNEWYYFVGEKGGIHILNGSITAPDRPPTKITLEEITEIVKAAILHREKLDWIGWMATRYQTAKA